MFERFSVLVIVMIMPFMFPAMSLHSLEATDRLGNPDIEFPIGMIFCDNDFFGTEGADEIVRNSKQFESGRSQIFKLTDCTHFSIKDQP